MLTREITAGAFPWVPSIAIAAWLAPALWKPADRLVFKFLLEEISGSEIVGKRRET